MGRRTSVFLAAGALISLISSGHAGLDIDAPLPAGAAMELVVMEAPGCAYCTLFRRDVLPSYETSPRAKELPIRFVDINDESAASLGLDAPVDMVPTFVILKNNHEIGRIPGYMGPEYFFHTINYLLSATP